MPLGRRPLRIGLVALSCTLGVAASVSVAYVARGDERAVTEARLVDLEKDPAHKAATAEMVRGAREAMERATRLRSAGDETHAKLADGLARELADSAVDLARAVDAEKQAETARRSAIDAGAHAERERALLEEGIAQNGRLRAELDEIERARKEAPLKTHAGGAADDAGVAPKAGASKAAAPPAGAGRTRADAGAP